MSSYSEAALKGLGKPVAKGSVEAKERMAYLRSLRGKSAKPQRSYGVITPGSFLDIGHWHHPRPARNPIAERERAEYMKRMFEKNLPKIRDAIKLAEAEDKGGNIIDVLRPLRPAPNPMADPKFRKMYLARKRKLEEAKGGWFMTPIFQGLRFWKNYGQSWKKDSESQKNELRRLQALKNYRGGKFEMRDLRDGLMGPIGWIRMGIRKKREREIDKLRKELGESETTARRSSIKRVA